jgi:uncharacterized OB-fold protein
MNSPARAWREHPQRYRLEADRCQGCSKVLYPPRQKCPSCGGREFETVVLPRKGRVVTHTVVRVPPSRFSGQAPVPIALVELEDGTRIMVQVADLPDLSRLQIGMPVRLEFRRISSESEADVLHYGHKAVPV